MKKKQLILKWWPLIFLFLCNISYAAVLEPISSFFQIAPNDESKSMLSMVFGKVGGLLGVEQGLLGNMFRIFNEAMMALATIVIIYTTIMSIINTAHQGEFLGKKYDKMWVPIRTVAGYALIIPTASGYSMIQIFMMWVVLQGIGAADTVWNTVIDYFDKGQTAVIVPIASTGGPIQLQAQNILYSTLCLQRAAYLSDSQNYFDSAIGPTPISDGNKVGYSFVFAGTPYTDCGRILWPSTNTPYIPNPNLSDSANLNNADIFHQKLVAMNEGFRRMTSDLNEDARNYIISTQRDKKLPSDVNPIYATVKNFNDSLNNIEMNYALQPQTTESMWDYARNDGWVFAGAYFHYIASLNNTVSGFSELNNVKYIQGNGDEYKTTADQNYVNYLFSNSIVVSSSPEQSASGGFMSYGETTNLRSFFTAATKWIVPVFNWMLTGNYSNNFPGSAYMAGKQYNPVIRIQILGNRIVQIVETIWAGLLLYGFGILLLTVVPIVGSALSSLFSFIKSYIVTPILWVLFLMLATGLSMSVYIPLIPYIIFTFGVIGWLIAVAETMLAAPMVALGLTNPEGQHEVLGRAEPALMLLTNVFIRPTLMLFGLFSGMVLAYVTVEFINMGFMAVVNSVASGFGGGTYHTGGGGITLTSDNIDPLQLCMFLVVYVSLVIAVLNRCFSLIHIFPDRVLGWISNTTNFGQYAGGEEEVKAGFKGAAPAAERGFQATKGQFEGIQDKIKGKIKSSGEGGKGDVGGH